MPLTGCNHLTERISNTRDNKTHKSNKNIGNNMDQSKTDEKTNMSSKNKLQEDFWLSKKESHQNSDSWALAVSLCLINFEPEIGIETKILMTILKKYILLWLSSSSFTTMELLPLHKRVFMRKILYRGFYKRKNESMV